MVKLLFLVVGVALLGFIVLQTDLAEAARLLGEIGFGFAVILAVYCAAFAIDALTWQLETPAVPLTPRWAWRFFLVRLAGESFNAVIPAGGLGGEPVKAYLLNRRYAISLQDAIASLILFKTITVIGFVVFLAAGFVLILGSDKLAATYKAISGVGLAVFGVGALAVFAIQRYKLASFAGATLSRRRWFRRIDAILHHLHAVEDRLVHFYTARGRRLAATLVLSLINWSLGVVEVYLVMRFIGHPVSFTDAWIIEVVAQLVRAATFFIPASIGAQEGAFLLIGAALTGHPSFGLTMALARRVREIVWALFGLAVFYGLRAQPVTASEGAKGSASDRPSD